MTTIVHGKGVGPWHVKQQIGTDAWLAVSARDPRWWTNANGDVVSVFRYGNRYGLSHWCEITYQSVSDDYGVLAYRIHRNGHKRVLYEQDGVLADSLGSIIREVNGQW